MNYWRMAFRWGSEGRELWPACRRLGIAAIGYYDARWQPVVRNCSTMTKSEFDDAWRGKQPGNTTGLSSLWRFARVMKPGDVIYVKQGRNIVGKGVVASDYRYQPGVMRDFGCKWEHCRDIKWDATSGAVPLLLGAEQFTLLPLNKTRLAMIARATRTSIRETKQTEVREGEMFRAEAAFRRRNGTLIATRKAQSDYRCEVCGMNFEEVYGDIGTDYIVAHHLKPIGNRQRASRTRLEDIALVCSNCHDMLHRRIPPYAVERLRQQLKRK